MLCLPSFCSKKTCLNNKHIAFKAIGTANITNFPFKATLKLVELNFIIFVNVANNVRTNCLFVPKVNLQGPEGPYYNTTTEAVSHCSIYTFI